MAELPELIRLLLALAIVIALMGGLALVLKKLGLANSMPQAKGDKRLKLVETLPLDARRRLMIVACDNTEHLVLIGTDDTIVVQTNIGQSREV